MADYLGSCKQDDFQKLRGGLIKHMVGPAMELSHSYGDRTSDQHESSRLNIKNICWIFQQTACYCRSKVVVKSKYNSLR